MENGSGGVDADNVTQRDSVMEKQRHKSIGISKHRLYELRYFCLQYRQFRYEASRGDESCKADMELIERVAEETGEAISDWLLRAVTTDISADKLIANGMPCCKEYFYERRRMFFEVLNQEKNRSKGTPD